MLELLLGWLLSTSYAAPPVTIVSTTVKEIEFVGNKEIDRDELKATLEFSEGDPLEKVRVSRSITNLIQAYHEKGFEKASVRVTEEKVATGEPHGVLVRIVIDEGLPTRIASIVLETEGLTDRLRLRLWADLRPQLLAQITLKPGDTAEHAVAQDAFREMESFLEERDFIGTKLLGIDFRNAEAPKDMNAKGASRWVEAVYRLQVGDRVIFGFRGNQEFSRTELIALVSEQKAAGFGPDYVEDIRKRLERYYLQRGYAQVKVDVKTFERSENRDRRVSYEISEGKRSEIETLVFEGNEVFSSAELTRRFYEEAPLLTSRGIFVQAELDKASQELIEWIQSRGYLSAKIIASTAKIRSDGKRVDVLIYLYEGDQTVVEKIRLDGVENIEAGVVKQTLGVDEGKPLDLFAFNEGLEELKAKYRDRGYLDVRILNEDAPDLVTYTNRNRGAGIDLKVYEGPQFRVAHIGIEGLTKTRAETAERELRFKVGDILEESKVLESERRLRKLGLFGSVKIQHRTNSADSTTKDVRVLLAEGTPGLLAGGVGVRNDLGLRVFGNAGYTNIWHRNHGISLTGNANRRFEDYCVQRSADKPLCFIEYEFRLGYTWPWFMLEELKFRPSLTQEKRRYREFDATSTALDIVFERTLYEEWNLTGYFTYSAELINQFNAKGNEDNPRFSPDNQKLTIGSITPSLSIDFRDNPLAPTKGFYARVSYEWAAPHFASQKEPFPVGYTKAQMRADQILPLVRGVSLFVSMRAGVERNLIDPKDYPSELTPFIGVPLIKQFTLGGAGSLRGFKEQEINFTEKVIAGTLAFVNYRTQLDLPLTGEMRWGPFLDAGNLLVDDYSLGRLRYAAGFGLHYQTPVGPVNFDWGFKLDPKPGEEASRFYFTVGIL